jgi:hypothetical protein
VEVLTPELEEAICEAARLDPRFMIAVLKTALYEQYIIHYDKLGMHQPFEQIVDKQMAALNELIAASEPYLAKVRLEEDRRRLEYLLNSIAGMRRPVPH